MYSSTDNVFFKFFGSFLVLAVRRCLSPQKGAGDPDQVFSLN